jgi:glycosyltransferase involved in cell wall biosynthesis
MIRGSVFTAVGTRHNPLPNIRYRRLFDLLHPEIHDLYSERRWVRWCQRRALRWPTLAWKFSRLDRRDRIFWATNWRHLRYVRRCPIVLDMDDPTFTPREVGALRASRNLVHLVVTTGTLKRRLREAGITTPITVIPNGVMPPTPELTGAGARERWAQRRWVPLFGAGTLKATRVIYAATLVRWHDIRLAIEAADRLPSDPADTCWLFVGRPEGFDPVKLRTGNRTFLDIVPHETLQGYLAGAHVGLYPRTQDFGGRMSIKLVEYGAFGLATLGVASSETEDFASAGAAAVAGPAGFCRLVTEYVRDHERLRALGARARGLAAGLEWPCLAQRYVALFASIRADPGAAANAG